MKSLTHAFWLMLLALALGSAVSSYLFAPLATFAHLAGEGTPAVVAANIAGDVFFRHQAFSAILLIVAGLMATRMEGSDVAGPGLRVALFFIIVALILIFIEFALITPRVVGLRMALGAEFGSVGLAPPDDPRRIAFNSVHGWSMTRGLAEILALGAGFLAAAWPRSPRP